MRHGPPSVWGVEATPEELLDEHTEWRRVARRCPVEKRIETGQRAPLTIGEVAEWLGCTERMVWKLKATRQIASVKVGRLVRIRPEAVESYIARNSLEVAS
jgi:excisionase family DNA binding protein